MEVLFHFRHAIELIRLEGTPALETMQSEMDSAYLDLTILLRLVISLSDNFKSHDPSCGHDLYAVT